MSNVRIYDGDGDALMEVSSGTSRMVILPNGDPRTVTQGERIRVMAGQHLLDDVVRGSYRTVICGVNDEDNASGILADLLRMIPTSQWTLGSATSYAKVFRNAVDVHAREDREPYILKFDLDRLLILALLRPVGRDHFTLEDLYRGFRTITRMLDGRFDRQPVASVSFLGARSNRLLDHEGNEPSFEAVLKAMHQAGYSGDVYPSVDMWEKAPTGLFATYPFPDSLNRMREGSS